MKVAKSRQIDIENEVKELNFASSKERNPEVEENSPLMNSYGDNKNELDGLKYDSIKSQREDLVYEG